MNDLAHENRVDPTRCPSRAALTDLALGKLPINQIESLGRHLERCAACQALVESLDGIEDSFVDGLKQNPDAALASVSPDLERQLQAAEAISKIAWQANSELHAADDPLPRQLGQYQLLERIGKGGVGVVYKARHEHLKRLVAIKLLPSQRWQAAAVDRFQREMEAVAALDHPNIVRAHDANEVDGTHYLVMELVQGTDLARLVRTQGPLPVAEACAIMRQAALGLQHAHESGLVHRDFKPSNVMLTETGHVKILDLGLARLLPVAGVPGAMTDTGQILGTADFMAPEQGLDARTADARSDLYSLGCTLYFLLTGQAPFFGKQHATFMQKVMAHTQLPVPAVRSLRPEVPEALHTLVERLLAKRPEERLSSAAQVAEALGAFTAGADLTALRVAMAGRLPTVPEKTSVRVSLAVPSASEAPHAALGSRPPVWLMGLLASLLMLPIAAGIYSGVSHQRHSPSHEAKQGLPVELVKPSSDIRQSEREPAIQPFRASATARNPETDDSPLPKPGFRRGPRPASWDSSKPLQARPTEFGAGEWAPQRGNQINSWQIIGPFPYDTNQKAFDSVHALEQDWIDLRERFPADPVKRAWEPCESYQPWSDLAKVTGTATPMGRAGVYYAVCWVKFPSFPHRITVQLDSSCPWKLWSNGALVASHVQPLEDKGTELQTFVRSGWNELLLKLVVPRERTDTFTPGFHFTVIEPGSESPDREPLSMNEPPRFQETNASSPLGDDVPFRRNK